MTRTTTALRSFSGGVLLANAIPHGVHGVSGRPFPTPFADPPGVGMSSPKLNIVWSIANLVTAGLVLRRAPRSPLALAAGAVVMGFFLVGYFGSVDGTLRTASA